MTTNVKALKEVLTLAKPVLIGKGLFDIFSYYTFDGDWVKVTNGLVSMFLPFPTNFTGAIPGTLLPLLNTLSTDTVTVKGEGEKFKVTTGKGSYKFPRLDESGFIMPLPKLLDAATVFSLDESLLEGIKRCMLSINTSEVIPTMSHVLIETTSDYTVLYGTDNKTISQYILNDRGSNVSSSNSRLRLSSEFCKLLGDLVKFTDSLPKLYVFRDLDGTDNNVVAVFTDGTMLQTKLPMLRSTEEINFESIIGVRVFEDLFMIPDGMDTALERAALVSESDDCTVTVDDGTLTLDTGSDVGVTNDVLPLTGTATNGKVTITPSMVARVLGVCRHMRIDSNGFMVLVGKSEHNENATFNYFIAGKQD